MAVTGYSTQFPDGRLLELKVETTKKDESLTMNFAYSIDGKKVTKGEAEAEFNKQPDHWQRGRTFQQMIDFWMGRQGAAR